MKTENTVSASSSQLDDKSILSLVLLLLKELLRLCVARLPAAVRNTCIPICTMIVLVTPLALWVAWSKLIFYIVLSTCAVALAVLLLLIWFSPDEYF